MYPQDIFKALARIEFFDKNTGRKCAIRSNGYIFMSDHEDMNPAMDDEMMDDEAMDMEDDMDMDSDDSDDEE